MLNYANLSDVEFEYLCQDIMQKKLNISLRRFAQGKDGGIDLTDDVLQTNIIVQVKHYNLSSIDALIRSLKKEKEKIKIHKPKQYYICCSKNLTPENIKELFANFSEYMSSDKNILTLNEIEDFLQSPENQDVLNKHYKLWIDSVGILQQTQNTDIFIDCEVLLSNIEKEKRFFVKTQAFEQATKCLDKNKTLFITGNPGVGKTTTSKMLVLYYATLGYRVRFTTNTSDFRELKKSLSLDKKLKEIILVDDCFGQAYFKMHDAQNEDLLSLIKYVNLSPNKLLILNSRITIFQEAKALKPDLVKSMEDGEYKTIILDVNALSDIEKAKIFYNHLFFNKTPIEYLNEIKKNKRYLNIIKHPNYNPRLISFICNPNRYKNISPSYYFEFVMKNLVNPREIWRDEYEEKLSKTDRILLMTLYSLTDETVDINLLKQCFEKRIEKELDVDKTINQFQSSLRRLTEGFISIVDEKGQKIMVANPSVNDYLDGRMEDNPLEKQAIIDNAFSIQQFERLLHHSDFERIIENSIESNNIEKFHFENEDRKIALIAYYIGKLQISNRNYIEYLKSYLSSPSPFYLKGQFYANQIYIIKSLITDEMCQIYELDKYIIENANLTSLFYNCKFEDTINLINIISPLFVGEHRKKFVKTAIELVKDAINDLADNVSADSYISNPESAIRYGMHEEYFDLDEAVSELEDEVVESALNDIANNIKKLPFDICIDEDFVDDIFWNVDGSEELIQSYMEDNDDDDDSDNKRLESAVSEIDYIFNRKL